MGDVRRLSRLQLTWRVVATAAGLILVARGSLVGSDIDWPFAPMSQFAFAVSPQGDIESNYVEADTTAGTTVEVPLNATGVGLGRAEVEGQLPRFIHDPSLLGAIAQAAARLHPGWPHYTRLRLMRKVTPLHNGKVGTPYVIQLASYDVPPHLLDGN
jgi:hypothetical protein